MQTENLTTTAFHSAESAEHYTPDLVVSPARAILGGFDLDPASCEQANRTIKAKRIYTREDDGLLQPWSGRVFLNPPGTCGWKADPTAKRGRRTIVCGNEGSCSCELVKKFWTKLYTEWTHGRVSSAIWIGFSVQQLQTLQNTAVGSPLGFPLCIPSRRVPYAGNSPPHASYIALLPPVIGRNETLARFVEAFSPLGVVMPNGWEI